MKKGETWESRGLSSVAVISRGFLMTITIYVFGTEDVIDVRGNSSVLCTFAKYIYRQVKRLELECAMVIQLQLHNVCTCTCTYIEIRGSHLVHYISTCSDSSLLTTYHRIKSIFPEATNVKITVSNLPCSLIRRGPITAGHEQPWLHCLNLGTA